MTPEQAFEFYDQIMAAQRFDRKETFISLQAQKVLGDFIKQHSPKPQSTETPIEATPKE